MSTNPAVLSFFAIMQIRQVLLMLFYLWSAPLAAQPAYLLNFYPCRTCTDDRTAEILNSLKFKNSFSDSVQRLKEITKTLNVLYGSGYLTAAVTGSERISNTLNVYLKTGMKFKWVSLSRGNVDEGILSLTGIRERFFDDRDFRPDEVALIMKKLLSWCEDNGYPFAVCSLDNVKIEENRISASLYLDIGSKIVIDSILIKGNSKLSHTYLQSYLSIHKGSLYHESDLSRISTRIRELPMVSELRPFEVAFHDTAATLYLYLKNQKASKLDGIIGVLPDNHETGKVNVTGDVSIRLLSAFGYGELIDFNWKLPESKTQDLKAHFNYPFLFQTPFGIDLGLNIYKKDSTYIQLSRIAGIQYSLHGGNYLQAFYEIKKSTLLNTTLYESVTELPPFADIRSQHYGISLRMSKLDYRLNPRRGYSVELTTSAGSKKITPNSKLKLVDYSVLKLKSTLYLASITADIYFPAGKRLVNNTGVITGYLSGEESFQNELYRIGGLRTLRGFDEESILASQYLILKNEWRYLLEENSYLLLFVNAAWYERKQHNYYVRDTPFGFGAGITFETKLGIFSLNYALGKEFENPVRFRAAKVHFGLINYF